MGTTSSYTNVSFLTGIPFDISYSHTRWFENQNEQHSYFEAFSKFTYEMNNFQKIGGQYYIDIKKPVSEMFSCNYLMFQNSEYSDKWFYCFITNMLSKSSHVTRVYFEVDVIQTWCFDVEFKPTFISREHETQINNWNVIPENIAIGNEYELIKEYSVRALPFYYIVICVKELFDVVSQHFKKRGSFIGTPNTLSYYVLPIPYPIEGQGPLPDYQFDAKNPIPDATHGYKTSNIETFQAIMKNFADNDKAPDNIVSIFITDYLPIEAVEDSSFKYTFTGCYQTNFSNGGTASDTPTTIYVIEETDTLNVIQEKKVVNVFDTFNESASKLKLYPYTIIEVSDGRGNVVNYKPEGLQSVNGDINVVFLGSIYYSNWVAYALDYYNSSTSLSRSDLLSNALINSDVQDVAVLDDKTTAYLQGKKNSIEAQRNTWGTDLKYQRISNGIRGATSVANIGLSASSGLGTPSSYLDDASNVAQSFTNYMKSGADYQNKIAEQNAMLEDIDNLPPSLIKQGSNISGGFGNNQIGVKVKIKRVKKEYLDNARSYFHAFGYKSNQLKLPNLHTRQYFNYIQTNMCNLQCKFYNEDIVKFKQIFDNGITLWHTNDLYNYDVVNTEL